MVSLISGFFAKLTTNILDFVLLYVVDGINLSWVCDVEVLFPDHQFVIIHELDHKITFCVLYYHIATFVSFM